MRLVQSESGMQFQMRAINLLGDATKLSVANNSVSLIVTHPPYLGTDTIRYGGDPSKQINFSQNEKKILKLLNKAVLEMERVLKPSGSLFIANFNINGFDAKFLTQTLSSTGLTFQGYYVQNSPEPNDNSGDPKRRITVWQHLTKGPKPFVDFINYKRLDSPIIDCLFNNIDDEADQKLEAEGFHVLDVMNRAIPDRFIKTHTFPGDYVLDPFGGSGLVAVTAAQLGRVGITNDISTKQFEAAQRRIELSL